MGNEQDAGATKHAVVAMLATLLEQNGIKRSTQEIEIELDNLMAQFMARTIEAEQAFAGIGRSTLIGYEAELARRKDGEQIRRLRKEGD